MYKVKRLISRARSHKFTSRRPNSFETRVSGLYGWYRSHVLPSLCSRRATWLLTFPMVAKRRPDGSNWGVPNDRSPLRSCFLITLSERQQTIMEKNTEVLLQVPCAETSTWTTASVLLAPKLKPRNRSKVCVRYAQKKDFASLSSSATDGVSSSPFPTKNVPKMWKR